MVRPRLLCQLLRYGVPSFGEYRDEVSQRVHLDIERASSFDVHVRVVRAVRVFVVHEWGPTAAVRVVHEPHTLNRVDRVFLFGLLGGLRLHAARRVVVLSIDAAASVAVHLRESRIVVLVVRTARAASVPIVELVQLAYDFVVGSVPGLFRIPRVRFIDTESLTLDGVERRGEGRVGIPRPARDAKLRDGM